MLRGRSKNLQYSALTPPGSLQNALDEQFAPGWQKLLKASVAGGATYFFEQVVGSPSIIGKTTTTCATRPQVFKVPQAASQCFYALNRCLALILTAYAAINFVALSFILFATIRICRTFTMRVAGVVAFSERLKLH